MASCQPHSLPCEVRLYCSPILAEVTEAESGEHLVQGQLDNELGPPHSTLRGALIIFSSAYGTHDPTRLPNPSKPADGRENICAHTVS